MRRPLLQAACLFLIVFSSTVLAVDGVDLQLGGGDESTTVVRASARWNWDKQWFTEGDWYVGGYWELGAGYWDGDSGRYRNGDISHIGITPVFRLIKKERLANGSKPFFEAAVGLHVMSDDKLGDNDLGGHITFADHISAGMQFGDRLEHEMSLRLEHFSNAGIHDDNDGMNFLTLRYGYNFD